MSKLNGLVRELVAHAKLAPSRGDPVDKVLARILLPKRATEAPQILLRPSLEQYRLLQHSPTTKLEASALSPAGGKAWVVEVDTVWILESELTNWGSEIQEVHMQLEPRGLWLREYNTADESSANCEIIFFISPNKRLHPFAPISCDSSGNRTVNVLRSTEVDLGVFGLFTFKKEFFWWANEGSESSVDSNLVAAGSLSESKEWFAENGEPIIAALDDFLLVCSLGTRTRTSCIGWKAAGNGGMITRYRPDISIPSGYSLPNLNDGLVDQTDFQEFARKTFAQLIASADVTALRAAIYAVVPSAPRLLESDFVALFSAVEELLLAYSRRQDMQTILPDEKWLHLSNDIKSIIKAALPSDKSARSLMYAKIGELNRAPTRAIYESFMAEYGIDTSDLWPMFGSAQGATLYDIRNWISHGEHLPRAVQDQLWIATEHLKWTVERILLTRLAWPIEKSEVRMNLLAMHSTAIRDLDVARAAITYSMKSCKVIP